MIFDKYVKQSRIGEGTFGDVYEVTDKSTNEKFGAKIMKKNLKDLSESEKADIKREIGIIFHISHPSILEFIYYGIDKDKMILITELGWKTLYDILKLDKEKQEQLGWNNTRKMIAIYSFVSAMWFLHSNNIVHRDISAKNIIFDNDLNLKIMDFGFSKVLNEYNIENSGKIGTIWFSPPEIFNDEYSKEGDIYASSILLYQIITNDNPYPNVMDPNGFLKSVHNGMRPKRKECINDSWWNLLTDCWQEDVTKRPTFDMIISRLRNDQNLILTNVDINQFNEAKEKCDNYEGEFDPNYEIELDQTIENKKRTVKKILIDIDPFESIYKKAKEMEETNIEEAAKYYMEAAENGHIDASYKYGLMLFNGNGVPVDKNTAVSYLKKAADNDHFEALKFYGSLLNNGIYVPVDKERAAFYLKRAADKGCMESMFNYAYLVSHFDTPFHQEAILYYCMAKKRGHAGAINNLGHKLYHGLGCTENKEIAASYFKKAADLGNILAMYNYGLMNEHGYNIPVDKKTAFKYYKMSADKNYKKGMQKVGKMLYYGEGVPRDRKEANKYWEKCYSPKEKKIWHVLEDLDDFEIINDKVNDNNRIKYGFVKATKQKIVAKYAYNDKDKEKLREEYNNLLRCNYPSIQKIIGIYESKEKDKELILLKQFCENFDISTKMDEIKKEYNTTGTKKPEINTIYNNIYKIIYGIADAMAYLEDNKMFHGNLNPSNILLDKYGCPIINNIIMKVDIDETKESKYISPEVKSTEKPTIKSDVYSFGFIIIELFAIKSTNIKDKLPPFLYDIVSKCIDNDPNKRPNFSSIKEMLFEKFSENELIKFYQKNVNEEIRCPITFFRAPKIIVDLQEITLLENEMIDDEELMCKTFFNERNLLNILQNVKYYQYIKLVMACGKLQTGKSTFLRRLTGNGAFYSGKGVATTTLGVLIDGPYSYKDIIDRVKDEEYKMLIPELEKDVNDNTVIFFIDSQGLGDERFKNKIYSSIFKRYLSFFCSLSDLCINICHFNDTYQICDEIIGAIRQAQMFKCTQSAYIDNSANKDEQNDSSVDQDKSAESTNVFDKIRNFITSFKKNKQNNKDKNDENKNENENDTITIDNEMTKILFLVRYSTENLDRYSGNELDLNEFNIIQPQIQESYLKEHKTLLNNYFKDKIKTLPLCNLQISLKYYISSVWYAVPDIINSLITSKEHTKDYFQDKIELAVSFLFSDFFKQFSNELEDVESQVSAIADGSLNIINGCINEYQNKTRNKEETIDQIYRYFAIIKSVIIPFTIGLDLKISIQDKNQYSYDLIKDLTAYTAHKIPELKENLFNNVKELFMSYLNEFLGGGLASCTTTVISFAAQLTKKAFIQLAEKFLPLAFPVVGEVYTGVSISISLITFAAYLGFFINKIVKKKNKVNEIRTTNIKLSFPFLWEKTEKSDKKLVTKITFNYKSKKISSIVRSSEVIVVLENKESNFMKFVIQSMTGIPTYYKDELIKKKEIVVYGPFKPNYLLKRIERFNQNWKSFTKKEISIVYLREYDMKDLELLNQIKNQILFTISTNSIELYPKFETVNYIYRFDFLKKTNISYLRKHIIENEEKRIFKKYENIDYIIDTLPIWMDDCNSFVDLGPIVNKCLRHAFHRILTIKNSE